MTVKYKLPRSSMPEVFSAVEIHLFCYCSVLSAKIT